jgi:protocatechuate 3,4-dioxygenase beta subunit
VKDLSVWRVENWASASTRRQFLKHIAGVMVFPPIIGTRRQRFEIVQASQCQPTPPDVMGPFYKPDAPVRDWVGYGYMLTGKVLSADSCTPLVGAQIEFWLVSPNGNYSDDYRATVLSGEDGSYRFLSHFPPPYGSRPPHIHMRVTATGYSELITQHYPQKGESAAQFPLVLLPESKEV